jgi:ribonuclease HI
MQSKKAIIFTDGASRGNPGPAAIGAVIRDEKGKLHARISQCIGRTTNNQAEYRAIIAALEKAVELGATYVELNADSELAVKQINGRYRVKNTALKPLHRQVKQLQSLLAGFTVNYIPRRQNTEADRLTNTALDRAVD